MSLNQSQSIEALREQLLNVRVRKPFDYNRHAKNDPSAVLEPSDIILIEPFEQFGHFIVKENSTPEQLPMKIINCVTVSSPLAVLTSASQPAITRVLEEINVNKNQLAMCRIIALTHGFNVYIRQPQTTYRLLDKSGARGINSGNSITMFNNKYFSYVPEFALVEDVTPVSIEIKSTEPNHTNKNVLIGVLSTVYDIEQIKLNNRNDPKDPRIVTTVYVGARTKS